MRKRSKKRVFVLDDRHKLAAQVFAQGDYCGLQEAADRVGVHRSTIWRWWQHPEFVRYCERVRRAAVSAYLKSPEVRRESREMRREIRRRERELEKLNAQEKQAENVRWLIEHGAPDEVIREYAAQIKSASAKHAPKRDATL